MKPTDRIFQYMKAHGGITAADAFDDLGITQLAARIFDLKNTGVLIHTESEDGKNRYGEPCRYTRYRLG